MTYLFIFLKRIFQEHWRALAVAIVVGAVIVGPQIIFIERLGSAYRGIYMLKTDAEPHYLSRMEAALKGNGIGNPFVYEYRNEVPSGFYSYSETVLALPAKILPISIPDLNLYYKFLLPALLSLLVYALVFRLTGNKSWSLVAAIVLVLGSTALNAGTALNLLRGNFFYQQFLLFSRPVSPVVAEIVLFIYLQVLLSAHRRKSWVWFAALGILSGLSWYIYIYLATLIAALSGGYLVLSLLFKRYSLALRYGAAIMLGLLVGAPGTVAIASITRHPYYALFVGPIGLVHTHLPYVHIPWLFVTVLFFLYWYHHRAYQHAFILSGLLLTSFVVVNQQVFTGLSLHPGHYITYFCIPLYIILLCTIASEYFKTRPLFAVGFLQCAVCAYVFLAALFIQYSSYVHWAPIVREEQRNADVLSWLQSHTPRESVVMANPVLSELIPAYSADNVMWEAHANVYLMPQERWDFTPENARASKDFCAFIHRFRLEYIVEDSRSDPPLSEKQLSCLQPAADFEGFTIYKMKR